MPLCAPSWFQNLSSVALYNTRVRRSGAERLRAALPALQVLGVPSAA